jgi:uncharacterized membrane protein (UPF0127 family)
LKHYHLAALSLLAICSAFSQAETLPKVSLQAGIYRIQAEIASTPASRQLGLMHRIYLPAEDGMLFVFENKGLHCFWMRNTKIPLAIAFIGDDGKIVNIEEMQPMSDDNHCPAAPVSYALEMNQGWFSKKGLNAGNVISGIPRP